MGAADAAASDSSKIALVDSWIKSDDIDLFSPQLYTSGNEKEPEFDITPCTGDVCTYERLQPMKAKWVPSLHDKSQYPKVKKFFASKGIETSGFIVW